MKYMTKEWYEIMQKTDLHLSLEISKEAETYSDEYFNTLYNSEESDWLQTQEEMSNITFEDIYPDEVNLELPEGYTLPSDESEELEEIKRDYDDEREKAHETFEQSLLFDYEQEKRNFKEAFENNIKSLKDNLPERILKKVADIRVLALNRATAEVENEIRLFSESNQQLVEKALAEYSKNFKRDFGDNVPEFKADFGFHDCVVNTSEFIGEDLLLTLDNSDELSDINQVTFKNAHILKQDESLVDAFWLYEEIYRIDDGYEIHGLLQKDGLIDFIIRASDVQYN